MSSRRFADFLRRPLAGAALIAVAWMLTGIAYIRFSSARAVELVENVEALARLETIKGEVFILVTAVVLFVVCLAVLGRLEREQRRLLALEQELVEAEARSLPALFAASLRHDLDNVLQVALLQAEALQQDEAPPTVSAAARDLESSLRQLSTVGRRIRELGQTGPQVVLSRFRIDELLDAVIELGRAHASLRVCKLAADVEADATLFGNRALLGRALFNLLLNAAQATRQGEIVVRARQSHGEVRLEVHDDGPGVALELREQIFRPFFSTRSEGTGLGLVSVRAAAESFGGSIAIESSPLGGACFRLLLPRRTNSDSGAAAV